MAFAQFDDDESSDASDESSYSADESADDSADEESDDSVGSATASGDQWEGFKYEEMGLTQWEFQQAKEEGISREKLTHLVELGVRLSEYLQRPWEKLGVSEDQWLDERSAGMEDADIDRSYRNRSGDQAYAYVSLFLPSFYQWKTDKAMKAIWMDALWAPTSCPLPMPSSTPSGTATPTPTGSVSAFSPHRTRVWPAPS